jgi:anti-sigma regulatory factor (Ser/Thr protein kinase)/predicted transcriptional regulator
LPLSKIQRQNIITEIIHQIGSPSSNGFLDIDALAAHYGVSKQSVSRILSELQAENRVIAETAGRKKKYTLPREEIERDFPAAGLSEDKVFREYISAFIASAPETPRRNFAYAFTEMLNNAAEHSESEKITVRAAKTECYIEFSIRDYGVGIFRKIAQAMNLEDDTHAFLELAKGKFTTKPQNHSGEGIFFSAKAGDIFLIRCGQIAMTVSGSTRDTGSKYLFKAMDTLEPGTFVNFRIQNDHSETLAEVFDRYAPDGNGFVKTHIPIRLLEHDHIMPIVSRSQAKRLLARVEKFQSVTLDFDGVPEIGQGFADEIFRVFHNNHPEIELIPINCTTAVSNMIRHVCPSESV